MKKYRIVETRFEFYPQEKHWFGWMYIDNLVGNILWTESNKKHSKCDNYEYAVRCIERRKEWLENGSKFPIYHNIK
jgi:hypothetical protein